MFLFYFFSHPFPLKRILITIDKTSNNLTNTDITLISTSILSHLVDLNMPQSW